MAINDRFMLPKRVRTMEQMADLLAAEQAELDQTQRTITALENQLTISTSTFLLSRHEQIFGLFTSPEESPEIRRSKLLSKMNTRNAVSCLFLKTLTETFIDGVAEVKENYANYLFCIVVDVSEPPEKETVSALQQQIESVKPAHLIAELLIHIQRQSEHRLYAGFAVRVGRVATVGCEVPAGLEVTYVTDEAGNLLADEAGNRIID